MPASLLAEGLDVARFAREFAARGRVQIPGFLRPEVAARLQHCLLHEVPWTLAYRKDGRSQLLGHEPWRDMPLAEKQALVREIVAVARTEFQFMYESYMMVTAYKEGRDPELPLHALLEFLNSPEFLELGRRLIGAEDVALVDAQATRYMPGHFLTRHDDSGAPSGQQRRAAYVISLCEEWQPEWGGLLHFLEPDGRVSETFVPAYNTLSIFRAPQMHEVSYVAPYARVPRISITGWLRAS
jgi:Rps23 Pro-64 3,4-dihydroxylase Tpa1-like proline 4-hydroxylase